MSALWKCLRNVKDELIRYETACKVGRQAAEYIDALPLHESGFSNKLSNCQVSLRKNRYEPLKSNIEIRNVSQKWWLLAVHEGSQTGRDKQAEEHPRV